MNDLISRDDVYNVLKKVNIREMPIYVFDKLWNGIRDLPSIEPKERTAKVVRSEIIGEWKNMCGNCFEAGKKMGLVPEQKYCYECGCRLEWE